MTYQMAVKKACKLAKDKERIYFVVDASEGNDGGANRWEVATEFDLDTFFNGIAEFYVPFCTAEVAR